MNREDIDEHFIQKNLEGKRLKTLAKFINDHFSFKAVIVEGYCNTDRHISGTRLRHPGKGRTGNKLVVKDLEGKEIFRHNSAETYRCNQEVIDWIIRRNVWLTLQ